MIEWLGAVHKERPQKKHYFWLPPPFDRDVIYGWPLKADNVEKRKKNVMNNQRIVGFWFKRVVRQIKALGMFFSSSCSCVFSFVCRPQYYFRFAFSLGVTKNNFHMAKCNTAGKCQIISNNEQTIISLTRVILNITDNGMWPAWFYPINKFVQV